jgi:hypothetical protein
MLIDIDRLVGTHEGGITSPTVLNFLELYPFKAHSNLFLRNANTRSWSFVIGGYTIIYSDLYYLRRNKGLNTHCASFSCAKFYWRVAVLCASM